MTWDMLTEARGKLLGKTGNDIYEKWMILFKRTLDAGASGGTAEVNYALAAPYMKIIHDPDQLAINKGDVIAQAYASGKLGPVGSPGAVKTMEYLYDNRSDNSPTLANMMDVIYQWGKPDPLTGAERLISPGEAAIAQNMLQEYVRKNPKATSMDIALATDQLEKLVSDKAIRLKINESWKSKGTWWGIVGKGTPDMASVSDFTAHLQAGDYTYLKDTTELKLILDSVGATQLKDLEAKFAQPINNVKFKIDPKKTTKSQDGTPYFYDQFGSPYFYDRLVPGKPNEWHWYVRLMTGGKLAAPKVFK
jgi:hypothetical protein